MTGKMEVMNYRLMNFGILSEIPFFLTFTSDSFRFILHFLQISNAIHSFIPNGCSKSLLIRYSLGKCDDGSGVACGVPDTLYAVVLK